MLKTLGLKYKKENLGIFSSHFCMKSRLTLSPFHIYLFGGGCSLVIFVNQYLFVNQKNKIFLLNETTSD